VVDRLLTWLMCNQYGSSFWVSWTGDQYSMVKIAWIVSTDLTDVAIDHLMLLSARASRLGYNNRSLWSSEIAQPSAQTTENKVKDSGLTLSDVWRIGSSRHTSGFRILKNLAELISHTPFETSHKCRLTSQNTSQRHCR
jgi:hypothetical protein